MSTPDDNSNEPTASYDVSSNWEVVGNIKKFSNSISIGSADECLEGMTLEDIVDEKTCITIKQKGNDSEPCTVEIKLKNRGKKIKRLGIVSEASVLEIFQECGEYTTTVFTEMIDEFEDTAVSYATVAFERPSSEVSIKFTRINNNKSTMFLYGIRLLLQQSEVPNTTQDFDTSLINECLEKLMGKTNNVQGTLLSCIINKKLDNISNKYDLTVNNNANDVLQNDCENVESKSKFLTNQQYEKDEQIKTANINSTYFKNIEALIDLKITAMEQRLSRRIDLLESKTNEKLDKILESLNLLNKPTVNNK